MDGEQMFEAIRIYFSDEFPGYEVTDESRTGQGQSFVLQYGKQLHRVLFSNEFLTDHKPARINELLQRWDLAAALRSAGKSRLLVMTAGIKSGVD